MKPRKADRPLPPTRRRILVVEDDPRLASGIVMALKKNGFTVELCVDGEAAVTKATSEEFALVVLDLMLPDMSGLDVLDALRRRSSTPVLILTARTDLPTRLKSFQLGADDYLAKPFFTEELIARIETRLRIKREEPRRIVQWAGVHVDVDARRVSFEGRPLKLTAFEFDVLVFLMEREGRAVTRRQIAEQALSSLGQRSERTVDSHIAHLRRKLGAAGTALQTVWSVGYRFERPPA